MAYEARKREKAAMRSARSAARRTDPKEVRLGVAIAQGDMDLKLGQVRCAAL
jgi:translation initiation factor IF-3